MKLVPKSWTLKLAQQSLAHQENTPTYLFVAGVAGMTVSTILACRATLKVEEVLAVTEGNINLCKSTMETRPDEYSKQEAARDMAIIHIRGGANLVKLYAPAVLLGLASVAALSKSHNLMKQKNLALTAAYATVDEAFKKYRARIVEKYGEDEDRQFLHETREVVVTDEKGKELSVTRVNPDGETSLYSRFYDEYSTQWSPEPEYNFAYLRQQQNWFNDLLHMKGYVFLNDVYKALGLSPTEPGQVVGWMLNEGGDGYIDFGIWDSPGNGIVDFVNGRSNALLLDFNVDGVIHTKLAKFDKTKTEGFKPWQS